MLCGVIAYAVALEEAVAHPGQSLPPAARSALAAGLALFVGGTAAAMWRANCRRLVPRVAVSVVAAAAAVSLETAPTVSLAIVLGGAIAVAVVEERRYGPERLA